MLESLVERTWRQRQLEAYDYLLEVILDADTKCLIGRCGIENVVEWMKKGRYSIGQCGRVQSNG